MLPTLLRFTLPDIGGMLGMTLVIPLVMFQMMLSAGAIGVASVPLVGMAIGAGMDDLCPGCAGDGGLGPDHGGGGAFYRLER